MNDVKYIQYLVERFLDGLTTLDEEREIEAFVKANHNNLPAMPEDVQVVAEMFGQLRSVEPPSRIKRLNLLWRWAAAAVVVAAVAFGVSILSSVRQQVPSRQIDDVLIVKASRKVEALAADSISMDVPVVQSVRCAAAKEIKHLNHKKRVENKPYVQSEPMKVDAKTLDTPTRMPMATSVLMPVVSARAEMNELMLECELKILEDKYQAYASERRTIKI